MGKRYYLDALEIGISTKPYWDTRGAIEADATINVREANYYLSAQTVADEIRKLINSVNLQQEVEE